MRRIQKKEKKLERGALHTGIIEIGIVLLNGMAVEQKRFVVLFRQRERDTLRITEDIHPRNLKIDNVSGSIYVRDNIENNKV